MKREKLLEEQKGLVESLVEKIRYIYSEDFYKLSEFEKQNFMKDKMATEGHLSTVSNLLWSDVPQFNGLSDMFALGVLSSMFGSSFCSSSQSIDLLKKEKDKDKGEEDVFVIPENKAE